jgi:hypothetical protein
VSVAALSAAQLVAYNAADIDAFCACFHPEVEVLDEQGVRTLVGMASFRERYGALFRDWAPRATVDARLLLEPHVVEDEQWSRTHRLTGEVLSGRVLVRYTAAEGAIRWVEFLRA